MLDILKFTVNMLVILDVRLFLNVTFKIDNGGGGGKSNIIPSNVV